MRAAEPQRLADTPVGASFGHQLEDLPLAPGELGERLDPLFALDELLYLISVSPNGKVSGTAIYER